MTARVLLLWAVVLSASAASAQLPEDEAGDVDVDDETRARARALVDRAVAAFDAGEYQTALDHFRRGYELVPLEQLRFNIAMCYERLARLREAAIEYEALIDAENLSDVARRRAGEGVERLRSRFATVRFSGEEGVTVRIDADLTCVAPCELTADPGRHLVEGLGPEARSIELTEGEVLELVVEAPTETDAPDLLAIEEPEDPGYSPGPLFYTGAATTLIGVAGIITFGLLAQDRHADFTALPTDDLASDGALMRDLSNASIAVAAVGAVLVVLDIVLGVAAGDSAATESLAASAERQMSSLDAF